MGSDRSSDTGSEPRVVRLRDEVHGADRRSLWAYLDSEGNLRIDGQDLGPATAIVSEDGEYEWFQKIAKSELPKLRSLIGADEDDDLLDVLEQRWAGSKSYDLERLLRESSIEIERFVWS